MNFKRLSELTNNTKKVILFYSVIILIFYFPAFFTYFEGDEWYYFIQFFPYRENWYGIFQAIYKSIADTGSVSGGGHITPVSYGLWFLYNQFFSVNHFPYIISSIVIHIVNTSLVFILTKNLTKNRSIAFIAGLFFAVSAVIFQAVTWVMAFIWAELSVTFLLCTLVYLTKAIDTDREKEQKRNYLLTFLFFALAILTKETVVILFALVPIIIFLINRKAFNKLFFKLYALTVIIYMPLRFGASLLIDKTEAPQSKIDPLLYAFRAVVYPLKALVEIFIPSNYILKVTEFLTPLAYPTYGAEKEVRGTNFLTFTQSAGSDIIIYVLATALVIAIGYALKKTYANRKHDRTFSALTIGISIVILSALPLLLISLYAPWWGYVTFLDSRHLYLPAVGGAILFAYCVHYLTNTIENSSKKYFHKKFEYTSILFSLVIIWALLQYFTLQGYLKKYTEMGRQRTTVINKILKDNPTLPPKTMYLVTSNTGYYGFGPIPPFQTNFGQILTLLYYDKKQLPKEFMQSDYLSKGSLTGEGYKEVGERGFGYYITEKNFINAALDNNMPIESLYAFEWDGNNNSINNTTDKIRDKMKKIATTLEKYSKWQRVVDQSLQVSFRAPEGATVNQISSSDKNIHSQYQIVDKGNSTNIIFWKKVFNVGIFEDISLMNNADGEVIGQDFYMQNIPSLFSDPITTKISSKGKSMQYFLPTVVPNIIVEVTAVNSKAELNKENKYIEEIISLIKYPDTKQ